MKNKVGKHLFYGLFILIVSVFILLMIPKTWSALNPDKPPMGYYFYAPTVFAIFSGLEKIVTMTPLVPDGVEEIKNIEYKNVNGKSLQLDLYIPKKLPRPAPLLVFIHGGGWRSGQRSDYMVYLVHFANMGYVTATVSYRLLKDAPYPACVEDICDAVKWFYVNGEKYNYDPDRIALIGGSAGAHLSMLAGYGWKETSTAADTVSDKNDAVPPTRTRHKIKVVVDIYGPADLTTEYSRNHHLVTSFISKSWETAPELYKEASPVTWLDKNDPPTLILHGTADDLVPISQSVSLKHKLDSLGVPCVFKPLPGWPHTMDVSLRVNNYCKICMEQFFEKYLDN
jgi:acetyl esterase/lipase